MSDIDDRMPDQVILDPAGEAVGLAQWLATRVSASENATAATAPKSPVRPRRWLGVAGGVCAVALAAAVAVATHHSVDAAPSGHTASPVTASRTPAASLVSGNSAGCARSVSEPDLVAAVTGAVPLRARGGAQAVALFEAAYYRARSGVRARQVVAAPAAIPDAAGIQAGIDSLPARTTYCVHIDALAAGLYAVQLHESCPGEPETLWRQQISTNNDDGHTLIAAITPL